MVIAENYFIDWWRSNAGGWQHLVTLTVARGQHSISDENNTLSVSISGAS